MLMKDELEAWDMYAAAAIAGLCAATARGSQAADATSQGDAGYAAVIADAMLAERRVRLVPVP